jgi:hypothetical protein
VVIALAENDRIQTVISSAGADPSPSVVLADRNGMRMVVLNGIETDWEHSPTASVGQDRIGERR